MAESKRREAFASLASRFKKKGVEKPLHVRIPYSNDDSLFLKNCVDCEDTPCVGACYEEIIKLDKDKIPYLNFGANGCTYCDDCANACPNEVLHVEDKHDIEAKFSIHVGKCLAWNGTICSSCRDVCNEEAIEFFGVFRPTINADKCNGCGFCYGVCPPYAVEIKEK